MFKCNGYEEPKSVTLEDLYPEGDFLRFVSENDGRNFKQGSKQEENKRYVQYEDIAKVAKILKDLQYDIKKLTERVEQLEAHNKGYKTDEWGNYYLP